MSGRVCCQQKRELIVGRSPDWTKWRAEPRQGQCNWDRVMEMEENETTEFRERWGGGIGLPVVFWLWKKTNPFVSCLLQIGSFHSVERIFWEICNFPDICQCISLEWLVNIAPNLKFRKEEIRKIVCVIRPVPKQVLCSQGHTFLSWDLWTWSLDGL